MMVAMFGAIIASNGASANNSGMTLTGALLLLSGFGGFGYITFYIRLVKFSLLDFYNLLVRISFGNKYYLTFAIDQIAPLVNDELKAAIKMAVPDIAEKIFERYELFMAHHKYATGGDVILIMNDSPRSVCYPTPVEILLGGWIVKTKVAEMTGVELTFINHPIKRELTFSEKLAQRFGRVIDGKDLMIWKSIPLIYVYDTDETPDLMKQNLFGIQPIAGNAKEAKEVLDAITKNAIKVYARPWETELAGWKTYASEQERVLAKKLEHEFKTSKQQVNTPAQARRDSIKTAMKVLIVVFLIGAGILAFTQFQAGIENQCQIPYQNQNSNTTQITTTQITTTQMVQCKVTTQSTLANQFKNPQIKSYNLTIVVRGQGTTIPAPSTRPFQPNSNVALTAVPAAEWHFTEWCATTSPSSTTCTATYTSPSINVVVGSSLTMIAVFQPNSQSPLSTTSSTTTTATASITSQTSSEVKK